MKWTTVDHAKLPDANTVTVGSHVPIELATELRALARANERSVSAEVRLAIKKHLRNPEGGRS